ncbi:MAG: hypothetical protein Q7S65_05990 [Nanoarchaeota archaeon]|nr:hypothetical protein [Nanoarchaeota archaeon]
MVHFPSREIKDYRDNAGDRPKDYPGWLRGEQPATSFKRPYEPDAVQYRLKQGEFMSDEYLTITGTSGKLTNVGKLLSQAWNLEYMLRKAYDNTQPEIEAGVPHYQFMRYLKGKGLDQPYEVTHVQAGGLGKRTFAAVKEYCNRKFVMSVNENLESMLATYGPALSKDRAAHLEYLFLHETTHLAQRIDRYTHKTEEQVEEMVAGYASQVIAQISTAKNLSEKRRGELLRHWRQVKAIAEKRRFGARKNYSHLRGYRGAPQESRYNAGRAYSGPTYLKGGKSEQKQSGAKQAAKKTKPAASKARKAA